MPIYMRFYDEKNVPVDPRGTVKAKGFEGWIELTTFSWGNMPVGRTTGSTNPSPGVTSFSISKPVDATSPVLAGRAYTGKSWPTIVIVSVPERGGSLMRLTFSELYLTNFQFSGGGDGFETLSFDFANVKLEQAASAHG